MQSGFSHAGKQTDQTPDNNWQNSQVIVTGKQGTDFAAVGATITGKPGDTVTAEIGVTNNGPATLDHSHSGEPAAVAIVTPPDGAKVTGIPAGCFVSDDNSLRTPKGNGKTQYACGGNGGGQGDGLPITGPRTALYAGLGVLLLGAGVGGVLLARRRRTRFEA